MMTNFIGKLQSLRDLKSLSLGGCLQTRTAICSAICAFGNFRELELIYLHTPPSAFGTTFAALSHLPNLRFIHLRPAPELEAPPIAPASQSPGDGGFPALKRLDLETLNASGIVRLLQTIRFDSVCSLYLPRVYLDLGPSDCDILFRSIADAFSALEVLDMSFGDTAQAPLPFSLLRPVVTRLRLRTLRVEHIFPLRITQADVLELAQALGPTITDLRLNAHPRTECPPHLAFGMLDLSALLPLALHCHSLTHLAIYLDATVPAPLPPKTPKFTSDLATVCFGASPIRDPYQVIHFLSGIECLASISVARMGHSWSDGTQAWDMVARMIDLLQRQASMMLSEITALRREIADLKRIPMAKKEREFKAVIERKGEGSCWCWP
jgi:hypothetical protein